ncbi:MAG: FMN-binding protein [Acidimicrobiia bacterium]|nr:FMN-binding protein [Acidimicrobiia bacterium]
MVKPMNSKLPPKRPVVPAKTRSGAKKGDTFARRVVPALTLIGASGALLAALDRPTDGLDAAAGPPIAAGSDSSTITIAPSATVPTTVTTDSATTNVPVAQDPSSVTPAPTTPAPTTPPAVETTVPPAPAACGAAILGPTISTKFGPVQVQASVDGTGFVCSAQGVVWPTADRKSVAINNQAIPLLDQWAAYQHDASFDSISGATYTSRAYKQSLQAIIDGARA